MHAEDIRAVTRATPFEPVKVFLSNGETYDIWHPDMILTGSGAAHIAVPSPGDPPDAGSRVKIVSLVHVIKIEKLAIPAAPPPAAPTP
jgi:hypothetical protein